MNCDIARSGSLINGGFFAFRREIFDYIKEGEASGGRTVPSIDLGETACGLSL